MTPEDAIGHIAWGAMEMSRDVEPSYGGVAMILRLVEERLRPVPEALLVLADLERRGPPEDLDFSRGVVYTALADAASMLLIAVARMPGLEEVKAPDRGVAQ